MSGSVRAFGPGPDWLNLGAMLDGEQAGIIGIYDAQLAPVAGYYVDTKQEVPCGRVASIKFSSDGRIGAHLVRHVFETQHFFSDQAKQGKALFTAPAKFTWDAAVLGKRAINDMWFSENRVAIDLAGTLLVGDLETGKQVTVSTLPAAPPGEYAYAAIAGKNVFVSRWHNGRRSWLVTDGTSLLPLLGDDEHDIRDLATDGTVIVWLEGRDPKPAPSGGVTFERYSLYKSAFTTDFAKLEPILLKADVPPLSHLVLANQRVVGIYTIEPPAYRSGALVVDLRTGEALRSELPNNYSWGYELYPAESELWGAVTPGPMVHFETVARVPYGRMAK